CCGTSTSEITEKEELECLAPSIPPKDLMSGNLQRLYSMARTLGHDINYRDSLWSCANIDKLKIYNVSYSYMLSLIDGDSEYSLWDYHAGWTKNVAESDEARITSYIENLIIKMEAEIDALDKKRQDVA